MEQESEDSLQQSLLDYDAQIGQLETLVQAGGDESSLAEVRDLLSQLRELRKLTEDSLLLAKKNRLLQMLSEPDSVWGVSSNQATTATATEQTTNVTQTTGESSANRTGDAVPGSEADILGMKCRAPLMQEWGATQYYNAMIYNVAEVDEAGNDQVRVLFTHPTHLPIKPCPHFLEGKCRFDDNQCRYSHGHVVLVTDLEAFHEPDYSLLAVGAPCLARYEADGLWYDATILASRDDNRWLVAFAAYNETAGLPVEDIFPQETVERSSDDDSDVDDVVAYSSVTASSALADAMTEHDSTWHLSGAKRALGDWERYTSGFGSKILAKMGYVPGHGLGKDLEGRVEPVDVKVLPPGVSLDTCAEMREKGDLNRLEKKRQRQSQKTERALEKEAEEESHNVFNFINDLCAKDQSEKKQQEQHHKQHKRKAKSQDDRKLDKKALNVKIFQNQEDVKSMKKKLQGLQQQLQRNMGTSLQAQCEQKIAAAQGGLRQLESREQSLQQLLRQNTAHVKLVVF